MIAGGPADRMLPKGFRILVVPIGLSMRPVRVMLGLPVVLRFSISTRVGAPVAPTLKWKGVEELSDLTLMSTRPLALPWLRTPMLPMTRFLVAYLSIWMWPSLVAWQKGV